MSRTRKADRPLFVATLLLVCTSVVMVYSASAYVAMDRFQQPNLFLAKQALWATLGLAVLFVASQVDYRLYRNDRVIWTLLGGVGVMLLAVLFSAPVNGTRRWFGIGGLGIQPSELAKIACVLFTAAMLERRMHRINDLLYSLGPIGIVTGFLMALIFLQPDFGTGLSLLVIVFVMVFAAGIKYRYLAYLALALTPLAVAFLMVAPYRVRRLMAFWDPKADPLGSGYHIIQSLIAVGNGGVRGKGLMAGMQKLYYLPEPHTDFIFSVIAEELGLIGASAVLVCFLVITWRGLRVSIRADDSFGSFVALGLTTMIGVQAFVNISMVLSLLPTKGIPLPMVSNGGSSLLVSLLAMGILLNVSQHESTVT
jgi:cell division protein FtsW